jgi:2-(1,2-epoxy-1,2-dihydrophenyl)acetyl-CoA isomerase
MKDNLDEVQNVGFAASLDKEAERLVRSAQTEEHREAVRAFVEKRPAVFR